MRILFTTFGSYGDLYPYLAVGTELRRRGHKVTIATSETYRSKVQGEGLGFVAVRPNMSLDDREMLAQLFDARRGTERVIRGIASMIRESWEDTLPAAEDADTIVTHPITFASVLAAKKLKKRWISSVLAPASFLSAYDPPVPAPAPWLHNLRVLGPGFMRMLLSFAMRYSLRWMVPILEFARQQNVAFDGNPLFEGGMSPVLVLALFSKVLAARQLDWPSQSVVTGFPFHAAAGESVLDSELSKFFDAGPAPVVFTLGSSAVGAAGAFYQESLKAVQRLGCRAVFLTGSHPQGLPDLLPAAVKAWPYAPHQLAFSRAAAIVHQGGIGTTAQAMRSGNPELIVPFSHDQFDNADRVRRLGAAEVLYRSRYDAKRAERALKKVLTDSALTSAAVQVSEAVRMENGMSAAADAIEGAGASQ